MIDYKEFKIESTMEMVAPYLLDIKVTISHPKQIVVSDYNYINCPDILYLSSSFITDISITDNTTTFIIRCLTDKMSIASDFYLLNTIPNYLKIKLQSI